MWVWRSSGSSRRWRRAALALAVLLVVWLHQPHWYPAWQLQWRIDQVVGAIEAEAARPACYRVEVRRRYWGSARSRREPPEVYEAHGTYHVDGKRFRVALDGRGVSENPASEPRPDHLFQTFDGVCLRSLSTALGPDQRRSPIPCVGATLTMSPSGALSAPPLWADPAGYGRLAPVPPGVLDAKSLHDAVRVGWQYVWGRRRIRVRWAARVSHRDAWLDPAHGWLVRRSCAREFYEGADCGVGAEPAVLRLSVPRVVRIDGHWLPRSVSRWGWKADAHDPALGGFGWAPGWVLAALRRVGLSSAWRRTHDETVRYGPWQPGEPLRPGDFAVEWPPGVTLRYYDCADHFHAGVTLRRGEADLAKYLATHQAERREATERWERERPERDAQEARSRREHRLHPDWPPST